MLDAKDLCKSGPRSAIGTILPERNDPNVNAGPSALLVFAAENGDIKFPHRVPITPETHEKLDRSFAKRESCCSSVSMLELVYDMQAFQAAAAGYFGGYTAKMQPIGQKETLR